MLGILSDAFKTAVYGVSDHNHVDWEDRFRRRTHFDEERRRNPYAEFRDFADRR